MAKAVDISTVDPQVVQDAIAYIAENLREADRDEVQASSGRPAEAVVMESYGLSTRAWLILDKTNLPIGVFGVAPSAAPGIGVAWMLGTDGVEDEAFSIARQTRRFVEEMHAEFPVLFNWIDARNDLSLRWLLWSGFHLVDADPAHGPEERLFLQFTRTPDVV